MPALEPILKPRSIAVVGASRSPDTIGHQVVANLVRHGFTGAVYPVNPSAAAVHSIRAYPGVAALPDVPDVAVVVVPKQHVLGVAEECGRLGVRGLVVISAGFKETGPEGMERERELMAVVRRHGMRMVGPNCMGVINTDPAVSMNATFAPTMPPFGRAAFVSQSGALGVSVLDYASEYGIGIAQFVSMGNKPDVSGNDVLLEWEHDPAVDVILMYVENFGNPRRFLEIASRISRRKPIIVVKAGRSTVGARAASSHTGALAASDAAVDALLAQAGVLRADSVEELFDMAMAFTGQPLPRSRRTAVLTNSGGPGILAADALERVGLQVVELAPQTVERLRPLFPPEASVRNPLDMIASANAAGYRAALGAMLADPGVDSVVAIFTPPLGVRTEDVAHAIAEVATAEGPAPPREVGATGERLRRAEAFDLVRRAARALIAAGEQATDIQLRTQAFALLGRDSMTLSERDFERVLRDADEAGVIVLRRGSGGWLVELPPGESVPRSEGASPTPAGGAPPPRHRKPVLAVLMGRDRLPQGKSELHRAGVPAYIFPESAARALAGMVRYREWAAREPREAPALEVDRDAAAAVLERTRADGRPRLSETEALELVAAYGIPTAPARLARSADDAARIAAELGYPVVMKVVSPQVVHKTDVGGVRVGIGNEEEARATFREILADVAAGAPGARVDGVLVQRMLRGGRETVAGITRDPSFGPLVMFGLGGIFVEVLRDVLFRVAPITALDAEDMVRGVRGVRLLEGVRGAARADFASLERALLSLSRLAADFPEIAELDINPLLAFPDGAVAVDARVMVGG
ncbi:MAG TPA: acetate--CoA ligase family protein [Gemmatimonadaceae bacterium]|nr:acetate--CoA ligase family protein [Gemmatimonadaceae bacterium]